MGLESAVVGKAAPGHEAEWDEIMEEWLEVEELEPGRFKRLNAIWAPHAVSLGVPRVGSDAAADRWLLDHKPPDDPRDDATYLAAHEGHFILELADEEVQARHVQGSDPAAPRFYNEVCSTRLLPDSDWLFELLVDGRTVDDLTATCFRLIMTPKQAQAYGEQILDAISKPLPAPPSADAAPLEPEPDPEPEPDQEPPPEPPRKRGLLGWLGIGAERPAPPPSRPSRAPEPEPTDFTEEDIAEERDLIREVGEFYRFWGSRGFHIHAWF